MKNVAERIQKTGDVMVDYFHYFALFVIGGAIVWSATYEYFQIMSSGHAKLKDILLLFMTLFTLSVVFLFLYYNQI